MCTFSYSQAFGEVLLVCTCVRLLLSGREQELGILTPLPIHPSYAFPGRSLLVPLRCLLVLRRSGCASPVFPGGEVGYAARGGALPGPRVRSFSRRGLIEAVSYGTRRRKGDGGTSTCPFFFLSLPVSDPRPPAALARPPFTEGPHQRGEHGVRQLYPTRVETSPS